MFLFTCVKERENKGLCNKLKNNNTVLKVFKSKATPCFMLISFLPEAFFIFCLTWRKDHLQSPIQTSDPLNLSTLCRKTSGFQDFSLPNSVLFSLSFDWCAAKHSWKSSQPLSWIFPAWCNVLMILYVVRHVQWHQNKRNILPLKRWTSLSSQADHLCFTYHETLWIPQTGLS